MKLVFFVIVQCLLLSVNISLCLDINCKIESKPCKSGNEPYIGECKPIFKCESASFLQNITNDSEGINVLVCCKHIRSAREANWGSHANWNMYSYRNPHPLPQSHEHMDKQTYTHANGYTHSNGYTHTNGEMNSNAYFPTNEYTNANGYTHSNGYTPTNGYTHSNGYTPSNTYTHTNGYPPTNGYAHSNGEMRSNAYFPTNEYTNANGYTQSNVYTPVNAFTHTNGYMHTNGYKPTNGYTYNRPTTVSRAYLPISPEQQGYHYENPNLQNLRSTTQKPQVGVSAIVGGLTADAGEFPFMAGLGWPMLSGGYDYRCGGFFVSPNRVVTAGHCARYRRIAPAVVRPGGLNLDASDNNPDIPIANVIPHHNYRPSQSYNDIAILMLSGNSPHGSAQLWRSTVINFSTATAIGYGHTQFAGRSSNILQKVNLTLFSNSFCSRFYPPQRRLEQGLISSQLCSGEIDEPKDVCQGDSGGPLLVRQNENGRTVPYIIGITSFGTGCAGGIPSIFTRISSFVPWIESFIS